VSRTDRHESTTSANGVKKGISATRRLCVLGGLSVKTSFSL
jgi:hypothetical protein